MMCVPPPSDTSARAARLVPAVRVGGGGPEGDLQEDPAAVRAAQRAAGCSAAAGGQVSPGHGLPGRQGQGCGHGAALH